MSNEQKIHSPMEAIRQWYRGLTRSQSTLAECGAEGLERMAHDIGVSSAELCKLASRGPESADLLCRRMEVLDLDHDEVARVERATFQDLQRVAACATARSAAPAILRAIPPTRSGRTTARMRRR